MGMKRTGVGLLGRVYGGVARAVCHRASRHLVAGLAVAVVPLSGGGFHGVSPLVSAAEEAAGRWHTTYVAAMAE
jgi:hypothetical protein